MHSPQQFTLVDIETTGTFRKGQKIIEIAILNVNGDEVVEEFSTLINPEIRIPYFITALTGITNEAVEHAPKFYEVAKKIVEMTEGRVFVAHNVFFDYNFIKYEFSELGYAFDREKLCTVRLARQLLPGHKSYSLGELCKDLSISNSHRHRALGDVQATFELFKILQRRASGAELLLDSKKLALPPALDRQSFEGLPHAIGVYSFFDDRGELLYVGKSLDIKKRVTQHFHPDLKRRKDIELKNRVAKINFTLFPHELAALVVECLEIKKHFPPYNFALKRRRFPFALNLKLSHQGIYEIVCSHNDGSFHPFFAVKSKKVGERKIDAIYRSMVGPFETSFEKQAKLDLMIRTLGVEGFNRLMEKTFFRRIPQDKDLDLPLEDAQGTHGLIRFRDHRPVEMRLMNLDGDETIYHLDGDPDLASIILNYFHS